MAHKEQREYCEWVKLRWYAYFLGEPRVLDIGSLNINGDNRYLFQASSNYIGLDLGEGKNVDVVCKAHEYDAPDGSFDVIICTEMLEHDMYWRESLKNALRMLRSGGLMIITCASGARKEHGTLRSGQPTASPFTVLDDEWANYYCNLAPVDIHLALGLPDNFKVCEMMQSGWAHKADGLFYDLYFSGVKK